MAPPPPWIRYLKNKRKQKLYPVHQYAFFLAKDPGPDVFLCLKIMFKFDIFTMFYILMHTLTIPRLTIQQYNAFCVIVIN